MKTCQAVNETINMKDLNEMDQVLHKCYGVIDSAKVHHRTKYASRQTLLATIKTDLENLAAIKADVPLLRKWARDSMDVAKRLLRTARDGKYEDLSVEKLEIYIAARVKHIDIIASVDDAAWQIRSQMDDVFMRLEKAGP